MSWLDDKSVAGGSQEGSPAFPQERRAEPAPRSAGTGDRTLQAPGGDPGSAVAGCFSEVPPPVELALSDRPLSRGLFPAVGFADGRLGASGVRLLGIKMQSVLAQVCVHMLSFLFQPQLRAELLRLPGWLRKGGRAVLRARAVLFFPRGPQVPAAFPIPPGLRSPCPAESQWAFH